MIKKRNLDPSLIQWIMTQTGLGPGIGEIFYVALASATASQYRTQLESFGADDISLLPSVAEAKMVASRNDVLLVAPGAYLETAELDWDKANSHIIGMAGPNIMGDHSEPGVSIYSTGIGVVNTLHVTGAYSQFVNIGVVNNGANAACLAAVYLDIYGTVWKHCGIMGNMNSTQNAVAAAASLYIHTNAHYPLFEDCQIGSDVWGLRATANSGQVYFSGSQPNGGLFRRTHFKSISNTATCAMVTTKGSGTPVGRGWVFDDCHFGNFSSVPTAMNNVFYGYGAGAWWPIVLKKCSAQGYDEWTDQDNNYLLADMPATDSGGGITRPQTAVTYSGTDR